MTEPQMSELTPAAQAETAIHHLLTQIRDNPEAGWYFGFGTESFSLLTEAAASLWGKPIEEVRAAFLPRNARNPRENRG